MPFCSPPYATFTHPQAASAAAAAMASELPARVTAQLPIISPPTATRPRAAPRDGLSFGSRKVGRAGERQAAGGSSDETTEALPGRSLGSMDAEARLRRSAALQKFRDKRSKRCFKKKIHYTSRKQLAEARPRVRGQFVRIMPGEEPRPEDGLLALATTTV
jgi:hypothetical protein